jgi:hypothetical protein
VGFDGTFTSRFNLQGFYKSSTSGAGSVDSFKFAAGTVIAASNKVSEVVVDWSTPANNASTEANTIATATKAPALGIVGANHAFLFGGSVRDYQEFDATNGWTQITKYSDNSTNLPLREGARAEYLPVTNKLFVIGGRDGTTYHKLMDAVTP